VQAALAAPPIDEERGLMNDDVAKATGSQDVAVAVWDLPTRLFHWAIVLLVGFSWLSASQDWMDWHLRSGYTILTLLLFRLLWGLFGSQTARFAQFLAGPRRVLRHLVHLPRREPDREIGHNAAGGWMVVLMLVLLSVQAGTGLFSNDDILTEGPLAELVGKSTSDWLSHIHSLNFELIEIVVALHILAVLAYAALKRQDLVRPMLTGRKQLPAALPRPRVRHPLLALGLLGLAAAVVTFVVNHSW
jgi:cytochrome b